MSSNIMEWLRDGWSSIVGTNSRKKHPKGSANRPRVAQSKRWREKAEADGRTLYKGGRWVKP